MLKEIFKKEQISIFLISLLLAESVKQVSIGIISNLFLWGKSFGWFNIKEQMAFCLHQNVIIFVFGIAIFGFAVDQIVKNYGNFVSRKIFWFVLVIITLSWVFGHYRTINAAAPYEEKIFESIKYLICY